MSAEEPPTISFWTRLRKAIREWIPRLVRILSLLLGALGASLAIAVALGAQVLEFGGVIEEWEYLVLATFGIVSWLALELGSFVGPTVAFQQESQEEHAKLTKQVVALDDRLTRLRTELSNPTFHQIPALEVKERLFALMSTAEEWMHQGGSGTWVRHNVIPRLFAARGHSPTFHAVLVDPGEASAVEAYERYRTMTRHGDAASLRAGVLATIYCLAWARVHSRLRPFVYLVRSYEPLRFDGSQEGLIATVGTLNDAALWAGANTWYYRAKADALKELHGFGGYQIDLPGETELFPTAPTDGELRRFFSELDSSKQGEASGSLDALRSVSDAEIEFLLDDISQFIRTCVSGSR